MVAGPPRPVELCIGLPMNLDNQTPQSERRKARSGLSAQFPTVSIVYRRLRKDAVLGHALFENRFWGYGLK